MLTGIFVQHHVFCHPDKSFILFNLQCTKAPPAAATPPSFIFIQLLTTKRPITFIKEKHVSCFLFFRCLYYCHLLESIVSNFLFNCQFIQFFHTFIVFFLFLWLSDDDVFLTSSSICSVLSATITPPDDETTCYMSNAGPHACGRTNFTGQSYVFSSCRRPAADSQ